MDNSIIKFVDKINLIHIHILQGILYSEMNYDKSQP